MGSVCCALVNGIVCCQCGNGRRYRGWRLGYPACPLPTCRVGPCGSPTEAAPDGLEKGKHAVKVMLPLSTGICSFHRRRGEVGACLPSKCHSQIFSKLKRHSGDSILCRPAACAVTEHLWQSDNKTFPDQDGNTGVNGPTRGKAMEDWPWISTVVGIPFSGLVCTRKSLLAELHHEQDKLLLL